MIRHITSRENEYFKLARSLASGRGIRENGLFVIEGPKLLDEALQTNAPVHSVTFGDKSAGTFGSLIQTCENRGIPVYAMPEAMISQVCGTETPQGLFALARTPSFALPEALETLGGRIIALDAVQDPGNLGTILRCAAAFACSAVLIGKGCASPLNPKVIRSGMGAIFRIPVHECGELPETLERFSTHNYQIIAGHLAGTPTRPVLTDKTVLVIGNESRGISREAVERCTLLWRLNMPGHMESLNASVAAGIMMYELFARNN